MWWSDLVWGFWNGITAWVVLIVHSFGGWEGFPIYDVTRNGNLYDFGYLIGAGSPLLGGIGGGSRCRQSGTDLGRLDSQPPRRAASTGSTLVFRTVGMRTGHPLLPRFTFRWRRHRPGGGRRVVTLLTCIEVG
jgi:hypothetical protein